MADNTGKFDKAMLRTLCEVRDLLASLSGGPVVPEYDYEPVCTDEGTKILRYDNQSGAQALLNVDNTVNVTATVQPCENGIESDPVLVCASGTTLTMWVVKQDGQPTGVLYFTDNTGAIVPAPVSFNLGACPVESTPGIHLIESVGTGTYASPFTANCVTVAWDFEGVPFNEEIIVTVNGGGILGNRQFKVYANNQEQICFNSNVITSVDIPALVQGTVDIEFKGK